MLITKTVIIKWSSKTNKWYRNKGYVFTKWGDEFEVNVEDLTAGSGIGVKIECDGEGCTTPFLKNIRWCDYIKSGHKGGKYYCHKCAANLFAIKKGVKTKLMNGLSFYQWCYNNLSKEEADIILSRWDYNKNVDKDNNIITPKDVSFSSVGPDRKGYWFKCLDHPEHKSERRSISTYTSGKNGTINCSQCNTLAMTHPEFIKYLVDEKDLYEYSSGSNKSIILKCPECGFEKPMQIPRLLNQGFGCPRCSDGVSYPEKFMFNVLEQLNVDFKTQLNKTVFDWCNGYRYDFYIPILNCIIETHGIQHYERKLDKWMSLQETQENDRCKERIAKENSIVNYITLDCRDSKIDWIKNSIMTSNLPSLLGFKELDIDWLKCHESACNSLVRVVCDLWNSGINSTLEVANKLKISRPTATRYLNKGVQLGWCNYNPVEESEKNRLNKKQCKEVICLNTKEKFNSLKDACEMYNIKSSNMTYCCSNDYKAKTAGIDPNTGNALVWMFYDEYVLKNKVLGWFNDYMNIYGHNHKVVCLTTGEIFESQTVAAKEYKLINGGNIGSCCNKKAKSAGKHPDTGEPLRWMHYAEYVSSEINHII